MSSNRSTSLKDLKKQADNVSKSHPNTSAARDVYKQAKKSYNESLVVRNFRTATHTTPSKLFRTK